MSLVIISTTKSQHRAILDGQLLVDDQPTEIELVAQMQKHGINIRDWHTVSQSGRDFPFSWTWERNTPIK